MPLALRTANVSSLLAKFCGTSTLFFSDQDLLIMKRLVRFWMSRGLGPLVLTCTVASSILSFDDDLAVFDPAEPALEIRLTVDRLAHHQLGAPAGEAAIVVGAAQRTVEPGR